jgi:hypothetical protein
VDIFLVPYRFLSYLVKKLKSFKHSKTCIKWGFWNMDWPDQQRVINFRTGYQKKALQIRYLQGFFSLIPLINASLTS